MIAVVILCGQNYECFSFPSGDQEWNQDGQKIITPCVKQAIISQFHQHVVHFQNLLVITSMHENDTLFGYIKTNDWSLEVYHKENCIELNAV